MSYAVGAGVPACAPSMAVGHAITHAIYPMDARLRFAYAELLVGS
jgi:hypothetical protein